MNWNFERFFKKQPRVAVVTHGYKALTEAEKVEMETKLKTSVDTVVFVEAPATAGPVIPHIAVLPS